VYLVVRGESMKRRSLWPVLGVLACLVWGGPAAGQGPACGDDGQTLSPTRYLRALSLDLRGTIPTMEEHNRIIAAGEVPDQLIREMINSEAFKDEFYRFHRSLLWPNLAGDAQFHATADRIANVVRGTDLYDYTNGSGLQRAFRGANITCRNEPEADPDNIQPQIMPNGQRREGYVCVRPYYRQFGYVEDGSCAEGEIKVCAYAAQAHFISPVTGQRCDQRTNGFDPGCGCGPELRWCSNYFQFLQPLIGTMKAQIKWVLENDRPYYEMLAEAPPMVNGPAAHYYQHTAPAKGYELTVPPEMVPDIPYEDWDPIPIEGAGRHARGVLTHPLYLLRFMTHRARVDRYYNSFLCQPFQPPSEGINTNAGPPHPDLQQRNGCKYCHRILEPVGAHWGRYAEYTLRYLNPGDYPDFAPECIVCVNEGRCSQRCLTQYNLSTSPSHLPFLGYLKPFLFREPEHIPNINEGLPLLVRRDVINGRIATCAAKNVARWMSGRLPKPDEEQWLHALGEDFAAHGYDYKHLVFEFVTSEWYRRVR